MIIPFFIPHAGCPHTCLFCNQQVISGVRHQIPTVDQILDTVHGRLDTCPDIQAEVAFYGGSFTMLPRKIQQELLLSLEPLLASSRVTSIRISTRPDALDSDTLNFLALHKVKTIEIGVQSLDDIVLQQSRRGHTADDSIAAIKRVKAMGFRTGVQLLPGLPGDSPASAMQGLKQVALAGADFIRIYPAVVLAGTELAQIHQQGLYQPPSLDEGIELCARMLHFCLRSNLPVVRIGLQADEGLAQDGNILAGCWHPALGQLVRARLYHDLVLQLASMLKTEPFLLYCHPARLSDLTGHGRQSLKSLQRAGIVISEICTDQMLDADQIILKSPSQSIKGSIITSEIYKEF